MFWKISVVVVFCALAPLFAGELYYRAHDAESPTGMRHLEPYLGFGDYIDVAPNEIEDAGYYNTGLIYTYSPKKILASTGDLGRFVFDAAARPPATAPREARRTVVVTGASVTLGDGAKDPLRRWWKVLQAKLRAQLGTERIDVIPAAVRSFVSTQDRISLDLFVLPHRPDVVVNISGVNDVANLYYLSRPGDPYNMPVAFSRYYDFLFEQWFWCAKKSALARGLLKRYFSRRIEAEKRKVLADPRQMENYLQSIANIYADNVTHMSRRCDQDKVPCFFLLQPARELTAFYESVGQEDNPFSIAYPKIRALMAASSAKEKFQDISHLVDGHDEWFVDDVHLDETGQEKLAELVAQKLWASRKDWFGKGPASLKRPTER